jgi:hypothetical protein
VARPWWRGTIRWPSGVSRLLTSKPLSSRWPHFLALPIPGEEDRQNQQRGGEAVVPDNKMGSAGESPRSTMRSRLELLVDSSLASFSTTTGEGDRHNQARQNGEFMAVGDKAALAGGWHLQLWSLEDLRRLFAWSCFAANDSWLLYPEPSPVGPPRPAIPPRMTVFPCCGCMFFCVQNHPVMWHPWLRRAIG